MTGLPAEAIERARSIPIENEIDRRGIKLRGRIERVGPCPVCGGTDRFGVNIRKQLFNCRGCGAHGDVIALLSFLDGVGFREAVETLTDGAWRPSPVRRGGGNPAPLTTTTKAADDAAEREKARWFWRQRRPIAGSIAETYLRQARGYGGEIPATLGFLPARGDHPPALIAAFGMATEPEPGLLAITQAAVMAVQLVKLKPDGSDKADIEPNKIIIGAGALGSPIVLAPPNDLLGLAIAEGFEDALSIHEATGRGAWASGGAGRMPALADAVADYINCVTVIGDDDPAGRRYAPQLVARLCERGIEANAKVWPS
jgi:putative DNA primase/helicase